MRILNKPLAYLAIASLPAFFSCNGDGDVSAAVTRPEPYFSLAGYFGGEATRLQHRNPEIVKTVSKNGDEEQRRIRVADWKDEFGLFIDADINKPAWQNSYRVDSTDTSVTYTST